MSQPAPKTPSKRKATASLDSLLKIFTVPEASDSTLIRIEEEISKNLIGFLNTHVVAGDMDPTDLEKTFSDTRVPEEPTFVSEQADFLLKKLVAQSVHTASPNFIGHMTSCTPYFMLPLAKIMFALNQNLVKIETSKAFTPLERQVLAMLHRLVYQMDDNFYRRWVQDRYRSLGVFCSGGTVANITALWVARNRLLNSSSDPKRSVAEIGLPAALQERNLRGLAIVVSERGHYSLKKSADLIGIGKSNLISVPVDAYGKIRLTELRQTLQSLKKERMGVVAAIGIAGTTETGHVDPLDAMADITREFDCHFHVDAAWGGPTLFSQKHAHLLRGIERADSVTFDAHKQLYVPVGAGMVLFRDCTALNEIENHANYIIREGSRDLGKHTLEGSRPGMAMLVHSGLKIIGRQGYELLIDLGISRARQFAEMIESEPDFELISRPELNLLTYRFCPPSIRDRLSQLSGDELVKLNDHVSDLTVAMQKEQRQRGRTFVSRTRFAVAKYNRQVLTVFRVVLANPLTTGQVLREVLREQRELGQKLFADWTAR